MRAIAACIMGGISFEGGIGSVMGAFFGVVLMGVIQNAMNIIGVSGFYQTAILGIIIVVSVVLSNIRQMKKV